MMNDFKQYIKVSITEMRPYVHGETFYAGYCDFPNTSVSEELKKVGHPKVGDMICRDPNNQDDQWLITEKYFKKNYVKFRG